MKPLVLYHYPCTDGFGAAYCAWKKFGDDAEYRPIHLDQRGMAVVEEGRDVFVLDYCFSRDVLIEIHKKSRSVTVLDHHITTAKESADLPFVQLSMNKSGAGMAWDYFHPGSDCPPVLKAVEDRDLWRFSLEGTREICAYLDTLDLNFNVWDKTVMEGAEQARKQGRAILQYQEKLIKQICACAMVVDILGHSQVPMVSSQILASEVGNRLLDIFPDAPFAIVFYQRGDGKWKYSLRSHSDRADVEAIASRFGGGGHRNAAGFVLSSPI
nr:DHH family phosphoesterase [Bdellovibrio sp. HM001]